MFGGADIKGRPKGGSLNPLAQGEWEVVGESISLAGPKPFHPEP